MPFLMLAYNEYIFAIHLISRPPGCVRRLCSAGGRHARSERLAIMTTNQVLTANQWLVIVIVGIIFGALGQGARVIVGFKKMYDYAPDDAPMTTLVDGVRLLISFGIGGVAGAFAAVTIVSDLTKVPVEQLFAIAAAGYAGADFIEGFITRISGSASKGKSAAAAAGGQGGGQAADAAAAQVHPQQSSDDAVG